MNFHLSADDIYRISTYVIFLNSQKIQIQRNEKNCVLLFEKIQLCLITSEISIFEQN